MKDGNVGERLDAAGEHDVRVAEGDLVGRVVDRLRGGGARPVEGVRGHARRKLRQETDLPPDVRREHRGDHLAEDDLVHLAPVELGALGAPLRFHHARQPVDDHVQERADA